MFEEEEVATHHLSKLGTSCMYKTVKSLTHAVTFISMDASILCLFLLFAASTDSTGSVSTSHPLSPTPVTLHDSSPLRCNSSSNNNNSSLYVLAPSNLPSEESPTELVLTGFFPLDNFAGPQSMTTTRALIPAVLIALDEINNSSDILPGYHLTLAVRDTMCDATHAITELIDSITERLIGSPPPNSLNIGALGPNCAPVIEAVTGIISRFLNLPVVSYGLNLPVQTLLSKGPPSFHISRSILRTVKSAVGIMRHFNWTSNIAFVTEDSSEFFLSTIERVVMANETNHFFLNDGNGEPVPVSLFAEIQPTLSNSVTSFVENVRDRSIRVILGFVSQRVAAQLLCTTRSGVLPGSGFVYVFVGSYTENWWEVESEFCNLTRANVESVIVVSGEVINPNSSAVLLSGRTITDFKVEYRQRLHEWCGNDLLSAATADVFAGSLYDAVWALALALNKSVALIDSSIELGVQYDQDALRGIAQMLRSVDFDGVTGRVRFEEEGTRAGADLVQQIQNGSTAIVGWYLNRQLVVFESPGFVWNGDSVPDDAVTIVHKNVDIYLLAIVSIFTFCGIVFAIFMWVFNCYYSKHKILLASSQRLNYIIIVGVISGYMTVILLTILESPLGSEMSEEVFKAVCLIRIWMLPLSFTLTYGILFARAWRIYRVFNNPWTKTRIYKDYQLLLIVVVALAIDIAILIPWTIVDPYRRFLIPDVINFRMFSQCMFFSCSSTNSFAWLLAIAVYKIIFILAGILVISLIRKEVLERKIFDDSRALAVAVYVTSGAFVVGLTLTLLFIMASEVVLSYMVSVIWVNISSSGTLICVFIPKVYNIMIKKDSGSKYKTARSLYYGRNFSTDNSVAVHGMVSIDVPRRKPMYRQDAISSNSGVSCARYSPRSFSPRSFSPKHLSPSVSFSTNLTNRLGTSPDSITTEATYL